MDQVPLRSGSIDVADDAEEVYLDFVARGWTDGLPVIPPTEDRVRRMLAGTRLNPAEDLGAMPPSYAAVSVEKVAVNAVMAGCRPAYLPVLLAAVRAVLDPDFNLRAIQATTNPVTPLILVNGPVVREIGVNAGAGCLGPGWQANATIGRAMRLLLLNVGEGRPGVLDRATQGIPAKYTCCLAENEAESPFAPFHVERGFSPQQSVVSVIGAGGFLNVLNLADGRGDDLLRMLAASINAAGSNNPQVGGESLLILSPEHAHILKEGGFDKAAIRAYLFEHATVPAAVYSEAYHAFIRANRGDDWAQDGSIRIAAEPAELLLAVSGGPGPQSLYVQNFGDTRAVSRAVE